MHLAEVFAAGTPAFWSLVAFLALVVAVFVEAERGLLATATLIVGVVLVQLLGVDLLGLVLARPWAVAPVIAGYFAAGAGWAVVKWWVFVNDQRARYDELRGAFLHAFGYDPRGAMPEELQPAWRDCTRLAAAGPKRLAVLPRPGGNKARILRWMSYWPCSLALTVLNDPVRRAFLAVYRRLIATFQHITDAAFKGVEADLPPESPDEMTDLNDPVLTEYAVADLVAGQVRERAVVRGVTSGAA